MGEYMGGCNISAIVAATIIIMLGVDVTNISVITSIISDISNITSVSSTRESTSTKLVITIAAETATGVVNVLSPTIPAAEEMKNNKQFLQAMAISTAKLF